MKTYTFNLYSEYQLILMTYCYKQVKSFNIYGNCSCLEHILYEFIDPENIVAPGASKIKIILFYKKWGKQNVTKWNANTQIETSALNYIHNHNHIHARKAASSPFITKNNNFHYEILYASSVFLVMVMKSREDDITYFIHIGPKGNL